VIEALVHAREAAARSTLEPAAPGAAAGKFATPGAAAKSAAVQPATTAAVEAAATTAVTAPATTAVTAPATTSVLGVSGNWRAERGNAQQSNGRCCQSPSDPGMRAMLV
jgi:hypothetical protein